MKDLTSKRLIYLKGALFLFLGLLSSGLLLLEMPSLRVGVLMAISIWSFCRFYYFIFYVIEKYVEPGNRYAGLWAFMVTKFSRQDQR